MITWQIWFCHCKYHCLADIIQCMHSRVCSHKCIRFEICDNCVVVFFSSRNIKTKETYIKLLGGLLYQIWRLNSITELNKPISIFNLNTDVFLKNSLTTGTTQFHTGNDKYNITSHCTYNFPLHEHLKIFSFEIHIIFFFFMKWNIKIILTNDFCYVTLWCKWRADPIMSHFLVRPQMFDFIVL